MSITGTCIKYGDDISTDLIYPGRYTYLMLTEEEMAQHALEDLDVDFARRDVSGMILVAGENFGCGSAREQAVKCIKQKGIAAVVVKGIARIYYRNCINEGLLPIVCPEAVEAVASGDEMTIDVERAVITVDGKEFPFPKFPPFVMDILRCGGLIASVKWEMAQGKASGERRES